MSGLFHRLPVRLRFSSVNPFPTVSVSNPACPGDLSGNVHDSVVLQIELLVQLVRPGSASITFFSLKITGIPMQQHE